MRGRDRRGPIDMRRAGLFRLVPSLEGFCFVGRDGVMGKSKRLFMRASFWLSGLALLLVFFTVTILATRDSHRTRGPVEELYALLEGSEFHSRTEGTAFTDYAAAVSLLRRHDWSRERFKRILGESVELPAGAEFEVLRNAATCVIRGATMRSGGLPGGFNLRTAVRVDSEELDLVDFTLPGDAALLVARSRVQREDFEGAVRLSQAALAMGLHFMSSGDSIFVFGGMRSCKHAVEALRRIARDTGDTDVEKACSSALVALDEEFRALKAVHSSGPSIWDMFGSLME